MLKLTRLFLTASMWLAGCAPGSFGNAQICETESNRQLAADEPAQSGTTPQAVFDALAEPTNARFSVEESSQGLALPDSFEAVMSFHPANGEEATGIDVVEGDCSRRLRVLADLTVSSNEIGLEAIIGGFVIPSDSIRPIIGFLSSAQQQPIAISVYEEPEPAYLLLDQFWDGEEPLQWTMFSGTDDIEEQSSSLASGTWTINF